MASPAIASGERLFGTEPDLEVATLGMSPAEAVAALGEKPPDVLLLDLSLRADPDLAALRSLAASGPPPATVVLVSAIEPHELLETLELGVRGVLIKDMEPRL